MTPSTQITSLLRRRMIEDMRMRKLTTKTQIGYYNKALIYGLLFEVAAERAMYQAKEASSNLIRFYDGADILPWMTQAGSRME